MIKKKNDLPQTTQCSYVGRLTSDPESTAYISGCQGEETMDISLMSKKVEKYLIMEY